ncbi:DUF6992 family protein [Dictyobacter kobayashii]|uniref:Uncharacterized protein n=1 Tax=Dictyobacter kobayashii TaxID=2014872 RepID=A0A402ABW5_9CHLR|nr:hypothetical protein [Dictyobacter kobayashii]GCE16594.1 hypothetical protein KDK_03940 [Dictyobacter kobayashii]
MSSTSENFYQYQRRRLGILCSWGMGSVILGSILSWVGHPFWKQFGLQALIWGAIDGALAIFGIRSARRKELRLIQGELSVTDERKEVRSFYRILAINAGLDVLYVLSGMWVLARFSAQPERQGLGLGILIQGLWLFCYDGFLCREVKRRWF